MPKRKREDEVNNISVKQNEEDNIKKSQKSNRDNHAEDTVHKNHSSKVPKLNLSGLDGLARPSNSRASSDSDERNVNDLPKPLLPFSKQGSSAKKPPLDEIKSWRNLISRDECKPLPDANLFKSFKIPKLAKKENNEIKFNAKESRNSSAEGRAVGSSFDRGLGENEVIKSKNRVVKRRNSIERNERFANRIGSGRSTKIPSRLTPRIYNTIPSVDEGKKVDGTLKKRREEDKGRFSNHTLEGTLPNVSSRNLQDNSSKYQEMMDKKSVRNGEITKAKFMKESSNTDSNKEVYKNNGLIVDRRLNRSKENIHIMKDGEINNDSMILKEKRSLVMKKVVELDSGDNESVDDYRYENSLLEISEVSQGKELLDQKSSEKGKIGFDETKEGILDTSPQHYWSFDEHNTFQSFTHERPLENFSDCGLSKMSNETLSKCNVDKESLEGSVSGTSQPTDRNKHKDISQSFKTDQSKTSKRNKVGFED